MGPIPANIAPGQHSVKATRIQAADHHVGMQSPVDNIHVVAQHVALRSQESWRHNHDAALPRHHGNPPHHILQQSARKAAFLASHRQCRDASARTDAPLSVPPPALLLLPTTLEERDTPAHPACSLFCLGVILFWIKSAM